MASLSFIMDVNDDQPLPGSRPPHNIRPKGTDDLGQLNSACATSFEPETDPGHVRSCPGLLDTPDQHHIKAAAPVAGQTRRRGASSRSHKPATATSRSKRAAGRKEEAVVPLSNPSSTPPSLSGSLARHSTRRRSRTSNESMDPSQYGPRPPTSPSPTGYGLQRPLPLHPIGTQFTPKITPKTGRVSKAKKGLPVHVCDICRPPKTFTRAEHLRRHQLGHGTPQFQCSGCDRAFHRADLLVRHQQKHEHESHGLSVSGSAHQSSHSSPAGPSLSAPRLPRTPGLGPAISRSASEAPASPNPAAGNQHNSAQLGSNNGVHAAAPQSSLRDFYGSYTLSPGLAIVNPAQSSSVHSSYHANLGGDYQPRTGPPPIYVVTQGIQQASLRATDVPELREASPWPSSASDSTYSTPVSDVSRNTRPWTSSQRLSPYPSAAPRGLQSSGSGMDGLQTLQPPLFAGSYSQAQSSEQHHTGTLNLPLSSAYSIPGTGYHTSSLGGSLSGSIRPRHAQHLESFSSVPARTPPLSTSGHGTTTLVSSTPPMSSHLDSMAGYARRKDIQMEAHHDLLESHTPMEALHIIGGLSGGYGGNNNLASPVADNTSYGSGGAAELDLASEIGGVMSTPVSMNIPLPAPVLAAIPRYLDLYWAHVDPLYPLIHRQSFDAGPEDVLKCAMAAVATQHIDNKEDRTRGNQLHEFAWQEVKRIPRWSLQTMQAILLCEYFARFRGRKAVTRPSKPFESLCSRVLYQSPAVLDHAILSGDEQHLPIQHRWRSWIDAESRRRLRSACLFADGHAAIYHQQRRAQDGNAQDAAAVEIVPLFGRSAKLWDARSADEWVNTLAADPGSLQTEYLPPIERLTQYDVQRRPLVDRMVILSMIALRLPRRQRPLPTTSLSANNAPDLEMSPRTRLGGSPFSADQQQQQQPFLLRQQHPYHNNNHDQHQPDPFDAVERISTLFPACPVANTYLALHHTPLRDLLAVGGDSWVFTQKVLPATSFHEHQKRLKAWATSTSTSTSTTTADKNAIDRGLAGLSVVRATIYAARAVLGFLDREMHLDQYSYQPKNHSQRQQGGNQSGTAASSNTGSAWSTDMSDYWAMYVCALICWAFIYPVRSNNASNGDSSGSPSLRGDSQSRGVSSPSPGILSGIIRHGEMSTTTTSADEDAISWLRMVAAEGVRLEDVVRVRGRREAGGVVGLVRKRLERDCVGARSRLYVDAVQVLRKLEEGAGWRWF